MGRAVRALQLGEFFLFGIFLVLTTQCPAAFAATPEEGIRAAVEAKLSSKDEVKKVYYEDYDRNGRAEAFVLSGLKKERKNPHSGQSESLYALWFGYQEPDGQLCLQKLRKDVTPESKLLKLKSTTLFCAADYCATSTPMDVYAVTENKAHVIFHGDMINEAGGDDLLSIHSTYDFEYDIAVHAKLGHTWKPYYFYYKAGKIRQYRGKKISLTRFRKYLNGKAMLRKYKKLGTVKSVIRRSNGLVHVNYVKRNSYGSKRYSYVTFSLKDGRLKKTNSGDGSYKTVLKIKKVN